ncbi:MAG: hypothetical protein DDG60_12010 [Anaerolineae bacterium]|nr:MAG: hypothetical protein DDG60_12010 [Anaerolineae bacterium]
MLQKFFELPLDKPELSAEKRSLYQLLSAGIPAIVTFQPLIGLAMLTIAGLTLAGYLDTPEDIYLLFIVASINILNGLLHLPTFSLLRRNRLGLVVLLLVLCNGVFSAAQILLWQGVIWFPLSLIVSVIAVFLAAPGLTRTQKIFILLIGILLSSAVIVIDRQINYPRLRMENLSHFLALLIYGLLTLAMVSIGVSNGLINFKTISRRMISNFSALTLTTVLVFITIGTFTNYLDSRKRAFEQLETISNLKASQIELILEEIHEQVSQPLEDTALLRLAQSILNSDPENAITKIDLELFRSYLFRLQRRPDEEYFLIDATGKVILSTNPNIQGLYISSFTLLEKAKQGHAFSIEKDFPGTPVQYSLFAIQPITQAERFLGMLALRTTFKTLNEIAQIAPTAQQTLETYLVSRIEGIDTPITQTRQFATQIESLPVQQAFDRLLTGNQGEYFNYANREVFGHSVWIPELQSVLISEIEQDEALAGLINSIPIYLSIGLLMILVAFTTVYSTSQAISRPIQDFAQKAAALAGGQLSIRIHSARRDELGALAESFNKMANELEVLVRTLESRVNERTKDLQKQANYLRIAAEVARDATTAQDLEELLNRAAQLILDRFNFYHTGIFLIDPEREYAILRASPTEAGRKMLERGHRLKIGQVGLVGYVAATGTPRIALDTGQDTAYFKNPLLPNTRSEAAIPLKLGDTVLGVLDVQSTQPEAFTQDDIATLQVMADQLALAIQRVELVNDLQRNLAELENTYKTFTSESWQQFSLQQDFKRGYVFDGFKLVPLQSLPEKAQSALKRGRTTILPPERENEGATVLTPLKLREQVLGILALQFDTPTVDPDTVGLLEETAARLAIAMENARLYTETQNLVQRERAVSEISNQIAASFNVENILRAAVIEIGKRMPDAEVIVQLETDQD